MRNDYATSFPSWVTKVAQFITTKLQAPLCVVLFKLTAESAK